MIKIADNTTVTPVIIGCDESSYREQVKKHHKNVYMETPFSESELFVVNGETFV